MPVGYEITKDGQQVLLPSTFSESLFKYYPPPDKGTFRYKNLYNLIAKQKIRTTSFEEVNDITDFNPHFEIVLSVKTLRNYYRYLRTQSTNPSIRQDFQNRFPDEKSILKIRRVTKKDKMLFYETIRKNINETGFISFSSDGLNQLMWSHYGMSHSGLCVEFHTSPYDTDKELSIDDFPITAFTTSIEYSSRRAVVNLDKNLPRMNPHDLQDASLMKSDVWSYENEWRYISKGIGGAIHKKGELIDIGKKSIKSISFGAKCSTETKDIISSFISKSGYRIPVYQVFMKDASYELLRKKL